MRWLAIGLLFLATLVTPLRAQGLRDQISDLFIFGAGRDPLFLAGSGDPNNPQSLQVHGSHFVPSANANNATIIGFLTSAISGSVGNLPVSATSSGPLFRFEGGVPVRTALSSGPVFGERAQTLGRGRVFAGANVSGLRFTTLRGEDLDNLRINFTHANVDFPGCDQTFGGDCTRMGVPSFENDVMELKLAIDLNVRVTSFFITYGVLDRVDVGVVVPIVSTSVEGESFAQVIPFGGSVAHYFAGTQTTPELSASRSVNGSATGVGDVALRLKVGLSDSPRAGLALLADARFPTGSAEDLLGAGKFAARGLAIMSARRGAFTPHANVGYLFRAGDQLNDAVLATLGFDHLLAPWATLAADVVSELEVGSSKLRVPQTVAIEAPFARTVDPTTIPNRRDDIVNASLGFKFTSQSGLGVVANGAWPLNRGGLRPTVIWTAGVEYTF